MLRFVLVLCPFALMAFAQFDTSQPPVPQQTLIPINSFPADAAADYQACLDRLRDRSWVDTPANTGNINLSPPDPNVGFTS